MKRLNKIFSGVSIAALAVGFILVLSGFIRAATTVSLGNADSFAILAGSGITIGGAVNTSNITGDIGSYSTATITGIGNAVLVGTNHAGDATTQLAKTSLDTAYGNAEGQTLPSVTAVVASTIDSFSGTGYTLSPGIYNSGSTMGITGTLTLNGGGDPNAVFIFQADSSLTTAGASIVSLTNGTQSCNVFWQVGSSATLGSDSFFKGNILALTDIGLGTTANVNGRVLARNGAVTLDGTNTITVAKCLPRLTVTKIVTNNSGGTKVISDFPLFIDGSSVTSGVASTTTAALHTVSETTDSGYTSVIGGDCAANGTITLAAGDVKTCTITNDDILATATINVVKTVVNDSGRNKVVADFSLFVNNAAVVSGVTNTFLAPAAYTVTETSDSNYIRTFSGDCDANGRLNLNPGDNKVCVITNNDIEPVRAIIPSFTAAPAAIPPVPPLITVVKVPNPLALPSGPGPVEYTYTLRNIGTIPVANITMVGDTCSPIILASGDVNANAKLEVDETWVYRCSTTLAATHTNTVTATGWANGISAVDIASATVIVGVPVVPPLIHVTKIPSPLALRAGGGTVTYTKTVTNPGTVALSNIRVTDDKCGTIKYISGDINGDAKLDTTETWVYTCKTNLTKTTTNTAFAEGEANSLIARDFAIATVVVAVPKLPNTGMVPLDKNTPWNIAILSGIVLASATLFIVLKKRTV